MKLLSALLAWLLLTAATLPVGNGPVRLCDPAGGGCRAVDLTEIRPQPGEFEIERVVTVRPEALPLSRPLMVWITATASAEVRWNGVPIGSNGRPGPDAASERPGRFVAHVPVPVALVRPGENIVSVRLSAHHLWLPVRRIVHVFEVTPYETPNLPGLGAYLPALLTLGALVAACIYFAAAFTLDRRDRGARLLALVAATTIAQLAIEVLRTFVAYTYPWHLARVGAIAVLATATAVLAAAYAAWRFAPEWRLRAPAATAAAAAASLLLVPWFDIKAIGAILAGLVAITLCARRGLRDRRPGSGVARAVAPLALVAMAWQRTAFLDQAYYLGIAGLLVALIAEQVSTLRLARRHRDSETARAAALEERLRRAMEAGEAIVQLKDGSRLHNVAAADILYVRAADDYCDVALEDGRTILVTTTLARFLETLPDGFLRVHKSYAVNRARVASQGPRPSGGRELVLDDGTSIPVGRTYGEAVTPRVATT
jgi:DNA-binding LytR/AlgR family response regulator